MARNQRIADKWHRQHVICVSHFKFSNTARGRYTAQREKLLTGWERKRDCVISTRATVLIFQSMCCIRDAQFSWILFASISTGTFDISSSNSSSSNSSKKIISVLNWTRRTAVLNRTTSTFLPSFYNHTKPQIDYIVSASRCKIWYTWLGNLYMRQLQWLLMPDKSGRAC